MFRLVTILLCGMTASALSAEESGLDRLMEGNKRFVEDRLQHCDGTSQRRQAVAANHEPFAVVVGCSDARVSTEILFDQGVGDLFVVRVAGNVIGPLELESIEFATLHLHASVILVLGHEKCGAVDAVVHGKTQGIKNLAKIIQPSVDKVRGQANLLEAATKANAIAMKTKLLQIPAFQKLVSEKKLEVQAGYYNLRTGAVEIL